MDMALDDMVANTRATQRGNRRPNARGGRRGSARQEVLGNTPASPTVRARATAQAPASTTQGPATKIIVSNLPVDVNEAQIKELFHHTIGPLREVNLSYDSNGKSKGVAQVHFQKKGDGNRAYEEYNNRLIDGKRPMKIEIIVDPRHVAPQALASRVAPATVAAADSGRGRATRGGRGGRRGGRREAPTKKSAADLDAEMEDYTASNQAAAAPPAAADAATA